MLTTALSCLSFIPNELEASPQNGRAMTLYQGQPCPPSIWLHTFDLNHLACCRRTARNADGEKARSTLRSRPCDGERKRMSVRRPTLPQRPLCPFRMAAQVEQARRSRLAWCDAPRARSCTQHRLGWADASSHCGAGARWSITLPESDVQSTCTCTSPSPSSSSGFWQP